MEFLPRFLPTPASSFFLFGPRGTGKTTWLRQEFPSAVFVNLLEPDKFRELSARPERPEDLRALRAFKTDFPEAEAFLLYRGDDRLNMKGILCLPVEEFLKELRPNRELVAPTVR